MQPNPSTVFYNTMKNLEPVTSDYKRAFLQATEDWYKYVGQDHHKDRDCHWEISKRYSYGYDYYPHTLNWSCSHEGYIGGEVFIQGESEEQVMKEVTNFINNYIKNNPYVPD